MLVSATGCTMIQFETEYSYVGDYYIDAIGIEGMNGYEIGDNLQEEGCKDTPFEGGINCIVIPTELFTNTLLHGYIETERINDPNGIIELPIGEYFLLESHLEGGYICLGNMADIRVTVTENEPAVLKVGMPLKQILEVNRQGRMLELNYKLVGLAGESYIDNQRNEAPGFTIHKGNKIIDSGKFEYG